MEHPIQTDPEVLEAIYQRFGYLQDYPLKLRARDCLTEITTKG